VLDGKRRELHRDGVAVSIEPQVFDLLLFLIDNRHRVVSKDDMIRAVWGGRIVSDSAVATRLNAARRAIGDDGSAQRLIRTVPRRGMRFVGHVREGRAPNTDDPNRTDAGATASEPCGKPSVAVLPFLNVSSDKEQDHIVDGISEDIVTGLARNRLLLVIAQTSSFSFKHRTGSVEAIARVLDARYVVSGSVRRDSGRMRISAQLIDAETGGHVWADRFDRQIEDLFAVQDEVTQAIVSAIDPAIFQAERHRALRIPPASLNAWEAWHRALWHFAKNNRPGALDCLQRAITLDPYFAAAHALKARLLLLHVTFGAGSPVTDNLAVAESAARTAVGLDPDSGLARAALAWVLDYKGQKAAALEEVETAIALSPNDPWTHLEKGRHLVFSGPSARPQASEPLAAALRLDPRGPTAFAVLQLQAFALYFDRDYRAAEAMAVRSIRASSEPRFRPHLFLAAALGQLGRIGEATVALGAATAVSPSHFKFITENRPLYMRAEDHEHLLAGLHKVGQWP
jgi:TolB-like protein